MIGRGNSLENEEDCHIEALYTGTEAEGFDVSSGGEWIYPTNYPVREYQKSIVSNALFKNTLVCLPTGLGKTFIAAVVMYNYHRWFPKHIIVFTAHSKPLVAQQVNACCNIMGIPSTLIAQLNGNMSHTNRKKQWDTKKIFFLTPQVFNNDLARGNVKAESIRCIVFDEAHKALGNQAYCQVIRSLKPFSCQFRVLALSATPGDDMNMVREVIKNLMISHLELRNEEDPDIKPYLHEKKIETIVVKLDSQILEIKDMFLKAVDKYIKPLMKHKLIPQSFSSIKPFLLVTKQKQFLQDSNIAPELRGVMISNFSASISLFHALEELVIHGMRSFVTKLKCLQTSEGSTNKAHYRIANDSDITCLIEHVETILGPDYNVSFDVNASLTKILDEVDSIRTDYKVVYSHPKFVALEKIIQDHFESSRDSTRVIVFCKSRQCTGEICNFLARFRPLVKPMIFIGQSQSSGGIVSKGFNQAAQLTVMKRFRDGVYNTLIATCVAEEGLDIGEVDLIVNFDSGKNSNTQVQRSGRTGRKRDGRVVNLVTEGKEHQNYNISVHKGKEINKRLSTDASKLPFYMGNPRLIPKALKPTCQEMFLIVNKQPEEEPKEKKKSKAVKKKVQNTTLDECPAKKKIKPDNTDEGYSTLATVSGSKREDKKLKKSDSNLCNDIEIIDLTENDNLNKSNILLYDDDIATSDNTWSLSNELEQSERAILLKFMNENRFKSRTNFRELVNLNKIKKYFKERKKTNQTDLMNRLKVTESFKLHDFDFDSLKENFDVQKFVSTLHEKSFLNCNKTSNDDRLHKNSSELRSTECIDKEIEIISKYEGIMNELDPNDFFKPLDYQLSLSAAKPVSSTPIRKVESVVEQKRDHENFDDLNFQNWDDDFLYSPQKCTVKNDKVETSAKKNASMISITQALDLVKNAVKKKNENVDVKELAKPTSPSSPILFMSQRIKTSRTKFAPTSPILTQNRKSRKCLEFKDAKDDSFVSRALSDNNDKFEDDDGNDSDLFAETELALQNIGNLEEKLKKIDDIECGKKSPLNVDLDENTQFYDIDDRNFGGDSIFDSIINKTNKSECVNGNKNNSSGMFGNSFIKNSSASLKTSTPAGKPKTVAARLLGFQNLSETKRDERQLETDPDSKSNQLPYACNFSLLADDDFSESCFNLDDKETVDKEKFEGRKDDESSNDSDIFTKKQIGGRKNDDVEREIKLFHESDDNSLSPGAVKAVRDVEMYERDERLAREAQNISSKLISWDSDNSEELFLPSKKQNKQLNTSDSPQVPEAKKIKRTCKKGKAEEFIEKEAEVSDHGDVISDDENTSGLDEYDSSFVDEREICTQAPDVDMTAKYLQSMKAAPVRPGAFKIPEPVREQDLNVFSQNVSDDDSDYENDSFCVADEEPSEINSEEISRISELELAEIILQNKNKRKRNVKESPASVKKKKKKFKRVLRIESDSEEENVEKKDSKKEQVESFCDNNDDIQKLFAEPFPMETEAFSSYSTEVKEPKKNNDVVPTMFVSSRQVATTPDITTCLRAKWNVRVHVRSAPNADYIVSWRVGINRISLSDFTSGSPAAKNSVKESIQQLSWNFQQPVLIIENDKNKGLPMTTGCHRLMWAKHSCKTIVKTFQYSVKLLFSRSKDETARLLVKVCLAESSNGHSINIVREITPDIEMKIKFFCSLPGVNVANAFRMTNKFSSIGSFMRCCDSVQNIMREMSLRKEAAVKIYQLLFTFPS